jgi:hypothetical protein
MTATRHDRLAEKFSEDGAARMLNRTDRRYWALYRTLDLSQSEVAAAVFSPVDVSQATVSRAIRKGDTAALVDEDYIQLGGDCDEDGIREEFRPEEWYEAYRDVLASAVTDRAALNVIAHENRVTPEWAARRFPELVGCNHHVAAHFGDEIPEYATEDHLNSLESVNTDKWK